jgi:putative Mn2+ efflux pump MntP
MNWVEDLLILAGISLDIFAAMECQGSLVAKVDKKHLALISGLIAAWQLAALFVGFYASVLLYGVRSGYDERFIGLVLAAVIFFGLGIRLSVKAVRNERVNEKREENLGFKRFLRMAAGTSIYTFLTGAAFGFLQTSLARVLVMIVCCTIVVVVAGMYTGYRLGFVHKTKAYVGGALLLFIAGVDVIVRYMIR